MNFYCNLLLYLVVYRIALLCSNFKKSADVEYYIYILILLYLSERSTTFEIYFHAHFYLACNDVFRDVGIILDVSGSMYPQPIVVANEVISEFVKIANFTQSGSHGALTIFSDRLALKPHEMFKIKFSDQLNVDDYLEDVKSITENAPRNKQTDIIYGLEVSLSKMFQTNSGMRQDALQVAILITDGDDDSPISAYEAKADMFNENKIRVLVVGVDDFNPKKLLKLVKSPEHFFKAEKFEDLLDNITEIIGALICEGMIPQFYVIYDYN